MGTREFSDKYDFNGGTEGRSPTGIIAVYGMKSAYRKDQGKFKVTSKKKPTEIPNGRVNIQRIP